jgi:hypothetical protein
MYGCLLGGREEDEEENGIEAPLWAFFTISGNSMIYLLQ